MDLDAAFINYSESESARNIMSKCTNHYPFFAPEDYQRRLIAWSFSSNTYAQWNPVNWSLPGQKNLAVLTRQIRNLQFLFRPDLRGHNNKMAIKLGFTVLLNTMLCIIFVSFHHQPQSKKQNSDARWRISFINDTRTKYFQTYLARPPFSLYLTV